LPVTKREAVYDDFYRLTELRSTYAGSSGNAPWVSPYEPEMQRGDRRPVPLQDSPERIREQRFSYDWLGNVVTSDDNQHLRYDRSLGQATYGTAIDGPHQLRKADGVEALYDAAGNLTQLKVRRSGVCRDGSDDHCGQWFAYDWDEIGQLARARRWDFSDLPAQTTLPSSLPTWDIRYTYSMGQRVLKSAGHLQQAPLHTLEIFDTLRIDRVPYNSAAGTFLEDPGQMRVLLGSVADAMLGGVGGAAEAFIDRRNVLPQKPGFDGVYMAFRLGDGLGSASAIVDAGTSELMERITYMPYGAVESDFRPARWNAYRSNYRFTGKEDDIEVGAIYFGMRYYQPYLYRWLSADPLFVHGNDAQTNAYAYVNGRALNAVDPVGLKEVIVDNPNCPAGYACIEILEVPDTADVMASSRPQDATELQRRLSDLAIENRKHAIEEYRTEKTGWAAFKEGISHLDWYVFGQPLEPPEFSEEVRGGPIFGPPAATLEGALARATRLHELAGGSAKFRNLNPTVVLVPEEGPVLVARGPTRGLTRGQVQAITPSQEAAVRMRPDNQVPRAIRIHPDIRVLVHALRQRLTPRALAVAGRTFCPLCIEAIEAFGGEVVAEGKEFGGALFRR
jgi:RHS repeat-associated protein